METAIQLHKLQHRRDRVRSKVPKIEPRLRKLDARSNPLANQDLLSKTPFDSLLEELVVVALVEPQAKRVPLDSYLLLKHMVTRFPEEKLQATAAMTEMVEFALKRLQQRFGSEVIVVEERASVGLKSRTLILDVCRGTLQALALASNLISDRRKGLLTRDKWRPIEKSGHQAAEGQTLEELLEIPSAVQAKEIEVGEEALKIIHTPSHRQKIVLQSVQSHGGVPFHEICFAATRDECKKTNPNCTKLHYRYVMNQNTDPSVGECSFLNACHKGLMCKFLHFEFDQVSQEIIKKLTSKPAKYPLVPQILKQWIRCDVRNFDFSVIGKFSVIMADPPWEIHQQLPYGTMTDHEMTSLNIGALMDEGYIFLWVTGRAMELGRECLKVWGYERVDEIIWLKINQVEKVIRTGRTGHWLNHSKEHCIVGVKGNPKFQIGLDCDVVVAGVRETSRKPDELYNMIERLAPGARKLEIFGREHNLKDGWMTLGNQLPDYHIVEKDVLERFKKRYPNGVTDIKASNPPPETIMTRSDSDLQLFD